MSESEQLTEEIQKEAIRLLADVTMTITNAVAIGMQQELLLAERLDELAPAGKEIAGAYLRNLKVQRDTLQELMEKLPRLLDMLGMDSDKDGRNG